MQLTGAVRRCERKAKRGEWTEGEPQSEKCVLCDDQTHSLLSLALSLSLSSASAAFLFCVCPCELHPQIPRAVALLLSFGCPSCKSQQRVCVCVCVCGSAFGSPFCLSLSSFISLSLSLCPYTCISLPPISLSPSICQRCIIALPLGPRRARPAKDAPSLSLSLSLSL